MIKTASYLTTIMVLFASLALAQAQDTIYTNSTNNMFLNQNKLSIRGYAQIDYNQPMTKGWRQNGNLEVHRFVLFTGYRFNEKLQFISEIEVEHGNEIFIEQAFAQYKISNGVNLRAGMMVLPMGIINEYHEPTTFHGVERPSVDTKIIPTTWRELAIGLTGVIPSISIRYQAYLTNGFLSHNGESGTLNASNGLRNGRQKGLRSTISSPNYSAKIDFYGIRNLKLGLSTYIGKTQSRLYDNILKDDEQAETKADSSVIGVVMIGADARYTNGPVEARLVYVMSNHSNSAAYNSFTSAEIGSRMTGFYIEGALDVLKLGSKQYKTGILPFIRYESYNSQASVKHLEPNPRHDIREITTGVSWRHGQSLSFKSDFQWITNGLDETTRQLNFGVGVWF